MKANRLTEVGAARTRVAVSGMIVPDDRKPGRRGYAFPHEWFTDGNHGVPAWMMAEFLAKLPPDAIVERWQYDPVDDRQVLLITSHSWRGEPWRLREVRGTLKETAPGRAVLAGLEVES